MYVCVWFSLYIWGVKHLDIFRTVSLLSRSNREVLPCRSVPGWRGQRTQVYLQPFQTALCKKSMWLSGMMFEPFLKGNSAIWFSWRKLQFGRYLAYRGDTRPTPCRKALVASWLPVTLILFSANLLLTSDSFKTRIHVSHLYAHYAAGLYIYVCIYIYIYIYIYGSHTLSRIWSIPRREHVLYKEQLFNADEGNNQRLMW
jgi:hypothetical protein